MVHDRATLLGGQTGSHMKFIMHTKVVKTTELRASDYVDFAVFRVAFGHHLDGRVAVVRSGNDLKSATAGVKLSRDEAAEVERASADDDERDLLDEAVARTETPGENDDEPWSGDDGE